MLKAAIAALLAASAVTAIAQSGESVPAVNWRVSQEDGGAPGDVQFTIEYHTPTSRSIHGNTVPLASLSGFTVAQLQSAAGAPVRFRLSRDAGVLDCSGIAQRGHGLGDCAFSPNPASAAMLARAATGTPTPMQLFNLTLNDIGRDYLDELQRQRYARPSIDDLVDAGNHGVTLGYVRGIGARGYRPGTVAGLVRMRDHGVTVSYIDQLAAHDIRDLTPDMLVRLRDHGVSATYVADLRALGYPRFSVDELIRLRDHGVSTDFVRQLHDLGEPRLTVEEMVALRDHGVTTDFVRAARQAGYGRLPVPQLTRLRDNGVTGDYLLALRDIGYDRLDADDVVRLRSNGIMPDFIRRMSTGGRRSVDELIRLRNGGA